MSYPPIMVRQWPFDGYSRQPVGTPSASRGIQAQFRPGYAGLVDDSSLSQGTAIQPQPIALRWPVQMRSSLGQKRPLDTLNAESKRSASRSRSAHRGGGVGELLTGGRHQARSAILHKEPSHPGAFRRYGSRRLGSGRPWLLERCHSVVKF